MRRIGLGKNLGKGYYNIIPNYDSYIHSLSAKGISLKACKKDKKSLYAMNSLSYQVVDESAKEYDFFENQYLEDWEIPLDLTEEEMENEDYEPMMNYIYPLPDNFEVPEDFREKLHNMTIVWINDEEKHYLALTGGGMDMTWEIAETYIDLGYYPPTAYCRLPRMAGKDYSSKKNKRIIDACKESLKASSGWKQSTLKQLEDLGK